MIEGIVEVVSKNGKGMKIGDQWYNTRKENTFTMKYKGAKVSFKANGNFVDLDTLKILEGPSGGGGFQKKSGYVDNSIGQGIGMAINNAVDLSIAQYDSFNADFVEKTAIEIYLLAEDLKARAAKGELKQDSEVVSDDDDY